MQTHNSTQGDIVGINKVFILLFFVHPCDRPPPPLPPPLWETRCTSKRARAQSATLASSYGRKLCEHLLHKSKCLIARVAGECAKLRARDESHGLSALVHKFWSLSSRQLNCCPVDQLQCSKTCQRESKPAVGRELWLHAKNRQPCRLRSSVAIHKS
jgi:hypothetical protein